MCLMSNRFANNHFTVLVLDTLQVDISKLVDEAL